MGQLFSERVPEAIPLACVDQPPADPAPPGVRTARRRNVERFVGASAPGALKVPLLEGTPGSWNDPQARVGGKRQVGVDQLEIKPVQVGQDLTHMQGLALLYQKLVALRPLISEKA